MSNLSSWMERFYSDRGWAIQSLNITYLRDCNPDTWEPNKFAPDRWNCTRILWKPGADRLIMSCLATTRPGAKAVDNPMNANGTFSILHNHLHKGCWELGRHITAHSNQSALIQCDTVVGTRDGNRDYMITGDRSYEDAGGVNQHTTNNEPLISAPINIGRYSYGCLVGAYPKTHYGVFMPALKNSGIKLFNTGVIYKDDWAEFTIRQQTIKAA
jgi:hypothetical protein